LDDDFIDDDDLYGNHDEGLGHDMAFEPDMSQSMSMSMIESVYASKQKPVNDNSGGASASDNEN